MSFKKNLYRLITLCAVTTALAACGDGGSSPQPPGPQTWFFPEGSALTDSQINSFDTQGLYYNVHSEANPGGEIRSQIIPSSPVFITDNGNPFTSNNISTLMSGDQEVPASTSKATGYGTIILDPVAKTISGVLVTDGIVGTAAHIHDGLPGVNGPVIVPLAGGPTVWTVPAGTVLTDAQIARLTAGAYYLNVHTTAAPNGEIRGQLNQQLRFALLSGPSEVPPVNTTASATGVLALNPANNQISGFVKTRGFTGTVAHIHEAAADANGPVIVPLTETPTGSGLWVVPAGQALTADQAASFNTNNLYYNVHSEANPGGEIRSQILAATVKIGTAALDGTKEVPPVTTAAAGTGIISINSVTKQVNGNIQTTGIAGTVAHIHEAAAGSNGPVVVPLTLTPPASSLPSAPLAVVTSSVVNGTVGSAYSQSLTATGGTAPYTWAVATGSLPAGLSLSAAGVISGTPTVAGTSSFSVRVTDSASPAATAIQALSLTITATSAATVLFSTQIQPIFTANCTTSCHSPGGQAAFLNLTVGNSFSGLLQSTPPRVVAGSSATSQFYLRITGALRPQMPLFRPPLSATDQTLIKDWIDQGAANN